MKQLFVLGLFPLLLGSSAMAASDFNGHWQGTGTFQDENMLHAVPADFDIVIKVAGSQLVIDECWTTAWKTCYHSDYAVNENAQIFDGEDKVGDIYSWKISIYRGNSQVSELMSFDLTEHRQLLFRYAYSNMDGMIMTKMAQLPEAAR